MKLEKLVLYTTFASIAVQLLTGVFGVYGLAQEVPPEHAPLKISLEIEMFVQAIELFFYVWIVTHFDIPTMAATRYRDWIFSTPLMLFSLMLYFTYEKHREQRQDTTNVWQEFVREHRLVYTILAANMAMLVFGYLGEIGTFSKLNATVLGFVGFAVAFFSMYQNFASKSVVGSRLFAVVATVWAFYGIVYLFPPAYQNISINFLDIVAKNFFGVYLAYKIVNLSPGI